MLWAMQETCPGVPPYRERETDTKSHRTGWVRGRGLETWRWLGKGREKTRPGVPLYGEGETETKTEDGVLC